MAPSVRLFAIPARARLLPAILARIQTEMPPAFAFAVLRAAFAAMAHPTRGVFGASGSACEIAAAVTASCCCCCGGSASLSSGVGAGVDGGGGGRGGGDGGVGAEDAAAGYRGAASRMRAARCEVRRVRCDLAVAPEGVGEGELARAADWRGVREGLRWCGKEDWRGRGLDYICCCSCCCPNRCR